MSTIAFRTTPDSFTHYLPYTHLNLSIFSQLPVSESIACTCLTDYKVSRSGNTSKGTDAIMLALVSDYQVLNKKCVITTQSKTTATVRALHY